MSPQRLVIAVLALAALVLGAALILAPKLSKPRTLSGYVEGEPLYLASPVSGLVTQMAVRRGDVVPEGALLFTVDARSLAAQQQAAGGQVVQAKAQMAVLEQNEAQARAAAVAAEATAAEAEREARRVEKILAANPGAVSRQEVDKARSAADVARAQAQAARLQAEAARAQVGTAEGQLGQAKGAEADAAARLSLAQARAPAGARIEDTYFQTGEWASANQPLVSLLPDERITVRFFAPEAEAARYRLGRQVRFSCDGCPAGLTATISYVSPRPEYTPPVIYSLESRDRLVFLVEARPANPGRLTPGLPVDVAPLPADGTR
ncbi:MAG: HlyD family efflux transporter periplasmic adaptor subunit [Caulobacteraceae bacterium]|nr:HlyD family efflux transporter periplasmic adaptor subunit [Caulobacteraceae bacterium]